MYLEEVSSNNLMKECLKHRISDLASESESKQKKKKNPKVAFVLVLYFGLLLEGVAHI
jgi:hypothetical protein